MGVQESKEKLEKTKVAGGYLTRGKKNNLHATIRNIKWWDEKFQTMGKVIKLDELTDEDKKSPTYTRLQGPFRLILLNE